jgi:hypothetical protein
MIPRTTSVGPLATAVANGYAQVQAGTAGTALTLNGSLVTSGIGTPDKPRRLIITSVGNDSGITFLVTGRQYLNGPIVTETLTGGNVGNATNLQGQAYSMLDYAQVISVVPSGNTVGNVTVGTNGVASTTWIRLDNFGYAPVALEVVVVRTVSYTVEAALRDPNIVAGYPAVGIPTITPAQMVWQPHQNLQTLAVNGFDNYTTVPEWVRCTLLSGTGSCTFTASQPVSALRL